MTTWRRTAIASIALIAILALGYAAYEYVKAKPPSWLVSLATRSSEPPPLPAGDTAPFSVPEGFIATVYARDLPGARVMTRDQRGTMLVSQTKDGKVVALPDRNGDGKSDGTIAILEGLDGPHGIRVLCGTPAPDADAGAEPCTLYVAEEGAVKSYRYDADSFDAQPMGTVAALPESGGHSTRTLLEHPDGRLLVSVGSSCNACSETHPVRATVQAIDLATNAMTTFATGLRNTVFMAIHPVTGEVWGTDNGRDLIGDDIPPDEVNIVQEGLDYGWPACYGKNVYDEDFDADSARACAGSTPSHIDLPAHSAALGLAFVPEEGWPEEYWHDAIVAFHGSWNRSEPTGYKVVRIGLDDRGALQGGEFEDFLTGFTPQGGDEDDAIGRPADVMAEPGGVVYVSDDRAGAIYRVSLAVPPR